MDTLRQDLAYALRALRQHPAFAVTAILTLALGIGASTAIFSVVNAVLLRPLPYRDADRVAVVWGELRARDLKHFPFSPGDYQDLKASTAAFEEMGALSPGGVSIRGDGGDPEQVNIVGVTPNLLPLLGARLALGRQFTAEDVAPPPPQPQPEGAQVGQPPPGPPPVQPLTMVILDHAFWQRRYGGDPRVIGKVVETGNGKSEIVGVLAPGFELLFPPAAGVEPVPAMYAAMRIDYENASRLDVFLRVVGRLKPGVSLATAHEQAERVAADLRRRYPISETAGLHFDVQYLHEDVVRAVRPVILALMGAVMLVLLIACANVANLLLVRAAARERELAVRATLGGSPWRLVRQLLGESVVLAGAAALIGLALAWGGVRLLVAVAPQDLPRLDDVRIDPAVLGFTMLAALVAAALFGVIPALRASRPDVAGVLRAGGRTPGLQGGHLLRSGVVVAEVALSFVLLVGGGLMIRSFVALQRSDPGYDHTNVLTFVARSLEATPNGRAAFARTLAERLRALPGVQAVTAATPFPLDGDVANARWGTPDAAADPAKFRQASAHVVLPGYFEAMRTRLVAGRAFAEPDNRAESKAIVVDERLAKKAFPGESAIGKQLLVRIRGQQPELLEIVGVVAHQRHETLAADGRETIYVADGFMGSGVSGTWAVRTTGDPAALAPAVRAVVRELDARLPVAQVQPMQALVDRARAPTRFALILISIFAGVAALLAAVGLYGVLATAVRQRTAEIGVRMAIGASSRNVFGLVVGEGMRLSGVGVAAGVVGALVLTRVMRSLLVDVRPTDPVSFSAAVGAFLLVAVAACWLPARRAARLAPTEALRGD